MTATRRRHRPCWILSRRGFRKKQRWHSINVSSVIYRARNIAKYFPEKTDNPSTNDRAIIDKRTEADFDKWQETRHSTGTRWNSRCRIPPNRVNRGISVSSGRNGHQRQWRLHLHVDLNSLVPILQKPQNLQAFYLNVVHFYNLERRETWERQLWELLKKIEDKRDDCNASCPQVVLVKQCCFFSRFYHYSKVIQVHWQVSMILFILNSSGCS